MNDRLLYDIECAFDKMKTIDSIVEEIDKYNGRTKYLNYNYEQLKKGKDRRTLLIVLLIILDIIIATLLLAAPNPSRFVASVALFFILIAPIIEIAAVQIRYHFVIKKQNQKKADKWWEEEAAPEAVAIARKIDEKKREIGNIITSDYVLDAIPINELCKKTIVDIHSIVEQERANSIKAAISVWIDDEIYKMEREEEREERRRQREAINDLNNKIDGLNRNMAQREFYEDLILMDLASRE